MNRKFRKLVRFFLPIATIVSVGLTVTSFSISQPIIQQNCLRKTHSNQSFQDAVQDAQDVQSCEQWQDLTPIVKENPKLIWEDDQVLMVAWRPDSTCSANPEQQSLACMRNPGETKVITNGPEDYFLWVTPVPEIKEFVVQQNYLNGSANLSDRLKQYLGLTPSGNYTRFVEIWVHPDDLIRPCFDTEVTDNHCDAERSAPLDQRLTEEQRAAHERRLAHARSSDYPFTGLGYTYDWGNSNTDIGASEFVVRDGATVTIHTNQSTSEYLQGLFRSRQ